MLPSFAEIDDYIKAEGAVTIPQLRNHFNQSGVFSCRLSDDVGGPMVAWKIRKPFWLRLQAYMKQDHVRTEASMSKFLASDFDVPSIKQQIVPLVLSHY